HQQEKYAVIRLSGYLKGRKPGDKSAGTVTGKVHFVLDAGYLSLANIKVESEGEYEDITVAHSIEVSLTRVPGNTANIVARPVQNVPGPQVVNNADYKAALPHIQKREFDKAIPLLEKAIETDPKLVPALGQLAYIYNVKKLYDKAIPHWKTIIELVPN